MNMKQVLIAALTASVLVATSVVVGVKIQEQVHSTFPHEPCVIEHIKEAQDGTTIRDSILTLLSPHARDTVSLNEVTDLILVESERARVDPLIVASIISVENPWLIADTLGAAGEVGIMQIMPFHRNSFACFGPLDDPGVNVCVGTRLFRSLLKQSVRAALLRYNGCQYAACAAYADKVQEAF
jgi:soluble lytic murein transglycosylase-like protein